MPSNDNVRIIVPIMYYNEVTKIKEDNIMAFPIGFMAQYHEKKAAGNKPVAAATIPKKSLVQIVFPGRGMPLTYFNDQFDLHKGDMVYVDGKLEGILGRVVEVNYNFKIKPSDYKRVVHVVDTEVHGKFYNAGSHFVSFDQTAISFEKILTWFRAPGNEEEYISGSDDTSFTLDDLDSMGVTAAIAERGHNYYLENRVRYLCVDGENGKAIVEGTDTYEVEFQFCDGEIRNLTCSCFCSYPCKHEVAAMLQLREALDFIMKDHEQDYGEASYFAAIERGTLLRFALDGKPGGCIAL